MKVTGIVRRIDDLGRIVIPREFRKSQNIRLGDLMEISCNVMGEIVIKKVERNLELSSLSKPYIEVLSSELHSLILISDNDKWIAGDGEGKNEFLGEPIPHIISNILSSREEFNGEISDLHIASDSFSYIAVLPIVGNSECYGGMFILSKTPIREENLLILKVSSLVLGNNMQKY